ncbi:hypothetical protein AO378_0404 [Moraxella catarrhalis]|nr:hypothetical protein AO378_0404 [Moraxella catarrhalis]
MRFNNKFANQAIKEAESKGFKVSKNQYRTMVLIKATVIQ